MEIGECGPSLVVEEEGGWHGSKRAKNGSSARRQRDGQNSAAGSPIISSDFTHLGEALI